MRRIYLESMLGLMACFLTGLITYEISVYQLNTDYEFVLQDYEAVAHQQLLDNIAKNQGIDAAHQAINQFVETTRNILRVHESGDDIPKLVTDFFTVNPTIPVFHDEERDLWFRLSGSNNTYNYFPNEQTLVREKIEFEDDLLWVFFISSFVVYGLGHLLIIFRRVNKLEQATLRFAEGDLSSRAETSGGSSIGTLNKSFNIMADRIFHLIESNRSLTNAVAHELRTPVFRIQWQAELLKDTSLSNEQRATVESIVEDTEEMEQMVDELLYYAKLDNSRLELVRESLLPADILNNTMNRWMKETDLNIHLSQPQVIDNSTLYIEADRRLINRALDNLVRNAFKYARTQVLIEVAADNNKLRIAIHDDGPGVGEEHKAHLFEPFYVGNKARNKAKSGHGLGLSIVKKICEQHDATIEIERSQTLQGALFIMTFPVCNKLTDKPIQ